MALKVHNSCLLIIAVTFFKKFILQKGVQNSTHTWYRIMQGDRKNIKQVENHTTKTLH